MPTVLITGSTSGLGRAFVRQYLEAGWEVYATCRHPDTAPSFDGAGNPRLHVEQMDVTLAGEIDAVRKKLSGQPIDLLISNAAEQGAPAPACSFGQLEVETWLELFRTNTIAPLKVTEAFLPNVRASQMKLLVYMSSRSGSIAERGTLPHHQPGGNYHYRTSKAALNSAIKSIAFDLKTEEIGVLALHPGWVRTKGGGATAPLSPDESVTRMRQTISAFTLQSTGSFQDLDGHNISW